jgi:hypothetical protein
LDPSVHIGITTVDELARANKRLFSCGGVGTMYSCVFFICGYSPCGSTILEMGETSIMGERVYQFPIGKLMFDLGMYGILAIVAVVVVLWFIKARETHHK